MGYGSDPYSSPEKHGLTMIGDIEWDDESYQFDMTAVWRDAEGGLYWADDSGCSCPSPFEDFQSIEELTKGTFYELATHLEGRKANAQSGDAAARVVELLSRVDGSGA